MVHAFLECISLKVNVIAWVEFDLADFKATVEHFCYFALRTPKKLFLYFYLERSQKHFAISLQGLPTPKTICSFLP